MEVTIRQASSIGGLTQARVVAGSPGLDGVIRYVNMMEGPDYSSWLGANPFSITCAYAIGDDRHAEILGARMVALPV